MPKYVMEQLTCYAHPTFDRPQHCPFFPNPIMYGKDTQAPTPTDDSPLLDNAGKKCIQQVAGSFLYYARAVDPTILTVLSNIPFKSHSYWEHQEDQFLNYMWTCLEPFSW